MKSNLIFEVFNNNLLPIILYVYYIMLFFGVMYFFIAHITRL